MPDIELQRLRKLRSRAEDLLATLTWDLKPFRSKDEKYGFRRTPEKPQDPGDVNVTTTCSCLMGLAHSRKLEEFYKKKSSVILPQILDNMMKVAWKSSGLKENNAFTTSLVIRLCGSLVESKHLSLDEVRALKKPWKRDSKTSSEAKTLELIAQQMSRQIGNFSINKYPPAAAIVYWFVDGVDHANFDLGEGWSVLCDFATDEFRRQRSLVVAKHTAMMDPVAMAMAACLCARLRTVIKRSSSAVAEKQTEGLPSAIELERAVVDLFPEQTPTGLWSKYFPLFHYNEAGSNFCYTFELLEAVLLEFGGKDSHILLEEIVISGLEKAVTSCETNRLQCNGPKDGDPAEKWIPYVGWNSGGNFKTLRRGQPESWATAVVHMFLRELINVLSRHIQQRLLKQYNAKNYDEEANGLSMLVDINVHIGVDELSLRTLLLSEFVSTFESFAGDKSELLLKTPAKKKQALSALLFGPPGTSKTEIAKGLAASLQWPLVEIDPSQFLQNTFQNIYVQAETIFKDVMDMYGVVVLFDELDALVQKRDGTDVPDTESKFLTTYMLPKLAKLHDQRRLIFLMATNFQEKFDDAIKRAGRFDFLLCMGPPSLEEKCSSLHVFLGRENVNEENKVSIAACGTMLLEHAKSYPKVRDQLELYTFLEFRSFVAKLGDVNEIAERVRNLGPEGIRDLVEVDSRSAGLRLVDLDLLNEPASSDAWKTSPWTNLQDLYSAEFHDEDKLKDEKGRLKPTVKYVIERKQSRRQI